MLQNPVVGEHFGREEGMMVNISLWRFFFAFAFVLTGCTRSAERNIDTFTLETGVALQGVKACDTDQRVQKPASVRKLPDGYEITVSTFFSCNSEATKPYLTVTNEKKATLVIESTSPKAIMGSSCECARTLIIKLTGRLDPGDTLYLLREHEVLGHLFMP